MTSVIAATNSSITYNKKNFWIDPVTANQYFVGVQYPEPKLPRHRGHPQHPDHQPQAETPIPLSNIATDLHREDSHGNPPCQFAARHRFDDERRRPRPGPRQDDVAKVLGKFGKKLGDGTWAPRPECVGEIPPTTLVGSKIILAGEYVRMQDTFKNLGLGLILASLLDLFPHGGPGQIFHRSACGHADRAPVPGRHSAHALLTGSAVNVQSLLGVHFHRGHQGRQHGADDRLRPGIAST